jgi:uncharacterized protein YndB with AHSA1/START domain
MPSTIRLHRVLRATPEKIYRAFLDADAKAKWLPPNGFTAKVHHLDAKVGGTYKMSFTNSPPARAIFLVENIPNWFRTSAFVIRTSLTIQICPASCR